LTSEQRDSLDLLCRTSSNRESQLAAFFNKEKLVATLELLEDIKLKCSGVCPPGEYVQRLGVKY
jgi:hypothetical protein